jgi:hypothetical protein
VDDSLWQGSGPDFTLSFGARQWILKVDEPCPGLCLDQGAKPTKLLALDRLAVSSRCDFEGFSARTLVGYERYRSSVRATFAPPSWGGLVVRASWWATALDVVDLEVQVTASSVGELEGLEVGIVSRVAWDSGDEQAERAVLVEARDSAWLCRNDTRDSLDGTSPERRLFSATRPPGPSLFRPPRGPDGVYYAEMAHPDDVARRVSFEALSTRSGAVSGRSIRYALFGLELEKGVILRARLRGCWMQSRNLEEDVALLYQRFLHEPLPLGP